MQKLGDIQYPDIYHTEVELFAVTETEKDKINILRNQYVGKSILISHSSLSQF